MAARSEHGLSGEKGQQQQQQQQQSSEAERRVSSKLAAGEVAEGGEKAPAHDASAAGGQVSSAAVAVAAAGGPQAGRSKSDLEEDVRTLRQDATEGETTELVSNRTIPYYCCSPHNNRKIA